MLRIISSLILTFFIFGSVSAGGGFYGAVSSICHEDNGYYQLRDKVNIFIEKKFLNRIHQLSETQSNGMIFKIDEHLKNISLENKFFLDNLLKNEALLEKYNSENIPEISLKKLNHFLDEYEKNRGYPPPLEEYNYSNYSLISHCNGLRGHKNRKSLIFYFSLRHIKYLVAEMLHDLTVNNQDRVEVKIKDLDGNLLHKTISNFSSSAEFSFGDNIPVGFGRTNKRYYLRMDISNKMGSNTLYGEKFSEAVGKTFFREIAGRELINNMEGASYEKVEKGFLLEFLILPRE